MNHQRYSELCPIYALGALDGEDLNDLKAHLETGCADCERQIREFSEVALSLPAALPEILPSPSLRSALMERISADSMAQAGFASKPLRPARRAKTPRTTSSWMPWGVAIAAVLLLSVAAGYLFRLNRQYTRQQSQLQQELRQIEHLQADLNQERAFVAFLRTPEVRGTRLLGTPKSPTATGIVFWSPKDTRAYFFASQLAIPPVGKIYQLWMITDKPISAGVFDVNRDGGASLLAEGLTGTSKAQKFAVTLEPAGGVPQPTGDMHLLGSL